MAGLAAGGDLPGDRSLIEDAVTRLLAVAPEGWAQLHGEFEPLSQPVFAQVTMRTAGGQPVPVQVPVEVFEALGEYQRRSAAAGSHWRRLVIDCHADGRLSAYTEPREPLPAVRRPRRWPARVLAAITVGCLAAAAAVFGLAWRWSPPPRADIIAVPAPPARQAEAFAVIQQWSAARNRQDMPAMWALACADPTDAVTGEIRAFVKPIPWAIDYPEAITDFQDNGSSVSVHYSLRAYPLSEEMKRAVEENQLQGRGFFDDQYTLVEEDGVLKICDSENPPGWRTP